jgi:hypothetical protein
LSSFVPNRTIQGYLSWLVQAIALADLGAGEHLSAGAYSLHATRTQAEPDTSEIGRRQYVQLRRFLEQYALTAQPILIGRVSQLLQTGAQTE